MKSSEGKGIKVKPLIIKNGIGSGGNYEVNQKSLDKNKTKELDWYSKFNEIWEDSRIISNYQIVIDQKKPDEIKSFISSLLDKQRTELLEEILEENFCDLDGTYDYDGIAQSVIDLHKKL